MEPLLGDMPLIGALSLFFLKKPVSPEWNNGMKDAAQFDYSNLNPAEVNDAAVWGNALEAIRKDLLWLKCKSCFKKLCNAATRPLFTQTAAS